ncbi:MAG: DUF5615 family PIN-like protein [Bacteroidetes bacterium]|nr:DUF5615 family PIN-like protein [Bacteroidota bacterium]MBU1719722.1 DUF5615 family PIN-like protein [Bacteroidota bacterium]
MKFLCDVHISYKIVRHLISLGFEAIHVNQILDKWHTTDKSICEYADLNDYVVITKDADFRDSYFISATPKKLIRIGLGNVSTNELLNIFTNLSGSIGDLNAKPNFLIEVNNQNISVISKE